jgi:hypothetical protein
MQGGELFDVTVSDALRLLTASQKTNSTHQYSRIIRLCSGADAQGASGAETRWPQQAGCFCAKRKSRALKGILGVPLTVELGSFFASLGEAFLS